jgi:hypothetical protein
MEFMQLGTTDYVALGCSNLLQKELGPARQNDKLRKKEEITC